MRNILVVLKAFPSKSAFESFVEMSGGDWNHDPTLDQGVLSRGEATIYVDYFDPKKSYPPHEFQALEKLIGVTPKAGVNIHIGHGEGSDDLASEVAGNLIARWGGYLDENIHEVTYEPDKDAANHEDGDTLR